MSDKAYFSIASGLFHWFNIMCCISEKLNCTHTVADEKKATEPGFECSWM